MDVFLKNIPIVKNILNGWFMAVSSKCSNVMQQKQESFDEKLAVCWFA